jgi:hypothetical protein
MVGYIRTRAADSDNGLDKGTDQQTVRTPAKCGTYQQSPNSRPDSSSALLSRRDEFDLKTATLLSLVQPFKPTFKRLQTPTHSEPACFHYQCAIADAMQCIHTKPWRTWTTVWTITYNACSLWQVTNTFRKTTTKAKE